MIVAWALFPIVLLAVCLGCGLAVERLAGWRLPGVLLASIGLVLVIVVATLMTYNGSTARFTTAAVVVLALGGYLTSIGRVRELRPERYALAVGLGVYAVLAAPVVLSGNATFLGYFVLNDTAVHLALIDQLLAHGRDLSGVPPSATSVILHPYLSTDYPIGAQVALGAVRPLVAQDVAWVFQPYLAVILSLGGVTLYQLLEGVVGSRRLRALCAFVAAQPGLVYGFYLEASIKELATTWIITLTVVLVVATLRGPLGWRRIVPLVVTTVAAFDVLNLAIAPWLGVPLAVFAALAASRARDLMRRAPRRRLALATGGFVAALAAISAPIIASAGHFFSVATEVLTKHGDLGNLSHPLSPWQLLGIWPSGDFRYPVGFSGALGRAEAALVSHFSVSKLLVADLLIAVAVASAVLGVTWALRRRAAGPLLLLAGSGLATLYLLSRASPYASAKVMMIFSLTVMLIAMLGAVAVHDLGGTNQRWARAGGWGLALVLAGAVLWTNLAAYRGASVASRARFAELASVGSRFAGQGPAFYNLSDEFAIHFLRREAPADPAIELPKERPGLAPRTTYMQKRAPWDLNELYEPYLQSFRLIVLARSPLRSRPPADYRLVYGGRFYEVWRKVAAPQVLENVPLAPLGRDFEPAAVPRCDTVLALAKRARSEHARLAYTTRPSLPVFMPVFAKRNPQKWRRYKEEPFSLVPRKEPGAVTGGLQVQSPGRYEVWLQGSFSRYVRVRIDGRRVGVATYELGPPGQYVPFGQVYLEAGIHQVSIRVPSESFAPGTRAINQVFGPLVLAPASGVQSVAQVDPAAARSLCGHSLDWIEIVR